MNFLFDFILITKIEPLFFKKAGKGHICNGGGVGFIILKNCSEINVSEDDAKKFTDGASTDATCLASLHRGIPPQTFYSIKSNQSPKNKESL